MEKLVKFRWRFLFVGDITMKIGGFDDYCFLSKVLLTGTFHLFSVVKGALSVAS